jgi:hypothetical protein
MLTRFEHLPNELFFDIFSVYFDGVQLYKSFFGLNSRFDSLLKSLNNVSLHLKDSNDDKSINLFSTNVVSLYISSIHKSIKFIPLLVNVRSITFVDPSVIQIMNLLEISHNLEHISIIWSNPYLVNLISARAFYELIFSGSSSENIRSCRFYLPESHSLYIEPKTISFPLLHSIYVQITNPMADFRRLVNLCPNLIRFEIEIIDNENSNEERIVFFNHYENINIRRFHIYNLLSIDIFDIYIEHLPNLEYLYISMKFPSYPLDVFEQISQIIHRINHLKNFYFRFSTDFWSLGQQQFEKLKQINHFFEKMSIKNQDDEIIFTNQ